jgi:dienelactone hydrolase
VALSETCVALILGREHAVAFLDLETNNWEQRIFPPDAVLGSICALAGDAVLVADYGASKARQVVRVSPAAATWQVVMETNSLVADLTASRSTKQVAWTDWQNTAMPWEESRIAVATLDENRECAFITSNNGALAQPFFEGDDLLYAEEVDEWFVPRRLGAPQEARFPAGEFRPDWMFGRHWLASVPSGVICVYVRDSVTRLGLWRRDGSFTSFEGCPVAVRDIATVGERILVLADEENDRFTLQWFDPSTGSWEKLPVRSNQVEGQGELRPSVHMTSNGTPYVFWPAQNAAFLALEGDLPGLVIGLHGGPTGYASLGYERLTDVLTQCGYNVVSVNYRGSASYGRRYRQALNGHWGEADVDDVVDVARSLQAAGVVNPKRTFVRGASAGGFTALLASRDDAFVGAVSLYGVTSLLQLSHSTHEFEASYVSLLVGSADEHSRVYVDRSPLTHVSDMASMLVIQGDEDEVVPVAQAELLVQRARAMGVRCEYLLLEGEGHGIRTPSNVLLALEKELAFYRSFD